MNNADSLQSVFEPSQSCIIHICFTPCVVFGQSTLLFLARNAFQSMLYKASRFFVLQKINYKKEFS
jgi:hypothetical protein